MATIDTDPWKVVKTATYPICDLDYSNFTKAAIIASYQQTIVEIIVYPILRCIYQSLVYPYYKQ